MKTSFFYRNSAKILKYLMSLFLTYNTIQYNTEFTINAVMPILNQINDKLDPKNYINSKNDKNDIVIREFRKNW